MDSNSSTLSQDMMTFVKLQRKGSVLLRDFLQHREGQTQQESYLSPVCNNSLSEHRLKGDPTLVKPFQIILLLLRKEEI